MLIVSILLTALLVFLGNIMEVILMVKLFLLGLIFLENRFFNPKDQLLFYKNFGITPLFLFFWVFFMDFLVSVIIFKLMKLGI